MSTWGVPGLAIGIVKDGEVIYEKAFGVKNLESHEKIDIHTVFQIASLSKTFTATLAGLYEEQNKISFSAPVTKYIPGLLLGSEDQTQKITLKSILSHTTGFPSHAGDPMIEGGQSFDDILKNFASLKILYEPGNVYDYQNVIYSIAGKSIENKIKQPFATLIKDKIFIPLDMQDASVGKDNFLNTTNKASPYVYNIYKREHLPVPYSTKYYVVSPAAGVNASIADMTKWLIFQMGQSEPIMKPETLKMLQSPIVKSPEETQRMKLFPGRVPTTYYGLGWRIYDYAGTKMINHSGMLNGFKSLLAFLPDQNIGMVILGNTTSKALGILRSAFFDEYLNLPKVDWNQYFKVDEEKAALAQAKRMQYRKKRRYKKR